MTTTSSDTAPARAAASAKGAARREKILRGVIAIIGRDGYHQQSLRELAKRWRWRRSTSSTTLRAARICCAAS
ncbi:hypothetical protein [Novosphingobium sp. MBES04]|uniref:hypothetical protein n=1 Tax=Novosphingobium sp. MBES04 TaxID=1206458 RepID=UPI001185332E|nr:hypothetical protein [Novosphingobium sp. MBES04]